MNIFIAGGTGTLGNELTRQLVDSHNITIFSRDELKQQDMRRRYPKAQFIIGNIRSPHDVESALTRTRPDVVFHVAALKQIDTCEANPDQCIETNILGTLTLARACVADGVPHMAFSSSDKACLPINIYGQSKAVSERYLFQMNQIQHRTRFAVFRWGNVIGSRGSAIPFFVECLRSGRPVPITHEDMTRFWIPISAAARFFFEHHDCSSLDTPMFPEMKAASVVRVVEALANLIGVKKYNIEMTGIRPGEKIHETIFSSHEGCCRSDTAAHFGDAELEDLLAPFVKGTK